MTFIPEIQIINYSIYQPLIKNIGTHSFQHCMRPNVLIFFKKKHIICQSEGFSGLIAALSMCVCLFIFKGKLGPISMRVHKAEQYFNQTGTDCSVNSCPELLKKGKERYVLPSHLQEKLVFLHMKP